MITKSTNFNNQNYIVISYVTKTLRFEFLTQIGLHLKDK